MKGMATMEKIFKMYSLIEWGLVAVGAVVVTTKVVNEFKGGSK